MKKLPSYLEIPIEGGTDIVLTQAIAIIREIDAADEHGPAYKIMLTNGEQYDFTYTPDRKWVDVDEANLAIYQQLHPEEFEKPKSRFDR